MKLKHVLLSLLLVVTLVSIFPVQRARAIPAFARREGVSCQNCHFRMPELNGDGNAYIRRGLREGTTSTQSWFDLGSKSAETGKTELGDPTALAWQNYLTILGHHTIEGAKGTKTTVNPGAVEAWLGGPLDAHWSAFATVGFDIETGETGVEQAYAQFNTSTSEKFFSVRAGQLVPMAIFVNGGGVIMPLSVPVMLESPVRDEVPWSPTTFVRGAEVGVVDSPRWNAYFGVGQPQLEGIDNTHTDGYASAEYIINDRGTSITAFGYRGEVAALDSAATSIGYDRVALFANFVAAKLKATVGGLYGKDRPTGGPDLKSKGGFALGEFLLAEQWALYGRYDYASREIPVGDDQKIDGPTIGLTFWAQTQVRLTVEAQFLKASGSDRDRTGVAELLWAF